MTSTVRDFMTAKVETLTPDDTLESAVRLELMREIRHIPIVDDKGKLVGIITDRDLKRAMPSLLTGATREQTESVLHNTKISQIMTRSPLTIAPGAPLREAVRILAERKFGALPVVEGERVVGIISEVDLLKAFLRVLEKEH